VAQDPDQVTVRDPSESGAAGSPPATPATERLRSEIEETRSEISETIDAIQARLRPGELMAHATQAVKNTTIEGARHLAATASQQATGVRRMSSRTAREALRQAQDHPAPAALVGIAATALLLGLMRRQRIRAAVRPGKLQERGPRPRRARVAPTMRNLPFFAAGAGALTWAIWTSRIATRGSRSSVPSPTMPD
jgi:Protein of unknown function (DUF3618)